MKGALLLMLRCATLLLPWPLRRRCLNYLFGYEIAPSARIGFSWVFPRSLTMQEGSRIGHFVVAIHLEALRLAPCATIDRGNWITGFSLGGSKHFTHILERRPELVLGAHSAITKYHHFDCTDCIEIGAFTTIAGYRSQLLTHSIDVLEGRQDARPIKIGDYCFVGTNCVILGGTSLPNRSILGASSLLNKAYMEENSLYAGVPARRIKEVGEGKYFHRTVGFVD